MKKKLYALMIALMLLAVPMVAFAQSGTETPDLTDFSAVLVWLATGGAIVAVNLVASKWLEAWDAWHELSPNVKRLVVVAFAALLSFAAQLVLQSYPEIVATIQPFWEFIVMLLIGLGGSQVMHSLERRT